MRVSSEDITGDNFIRNSNSLPGLLPFQPVTSLDMTSSRVIICHLGRMGKLKKVVDTNIEANSSASLEDKAVSDDNLTLEESKHERRKGGCIRFRLYLISYCS